MKKAMDGDSVKADSLVQPVLADWGATATSCCRRLQAAVAVVSVCAFSVLAPAAEAAECEGRIAEELRRVSLLPEEVSSIKIVANRGGGQAFTNYRVNAWTRRHSCRGYTVVTLTHYCAVLQSYTSGECKIEGSPRYQAW